jgi:hypothetical protein
VARPKEAAGVLVVVGVSVDGALDEEGSPPDEREKNVLCVSGTPEDGAVVLLVGEGPNVAVVVVVRRAAVGEAGVDGNSVVLRGVVGTSDVAVVLVGGSPDGATDADRAPDEAVDGATARK